MHGLIPYIDALADPLAAAGYVALAPALYSRLGTLATDAGGPPTAVAGMLVRQTSNPQVLDDLRGALNYSADYPAVGGATVGAIGFCAGGRSGLFLAAAGPRLRAFVAMHPTLTDETPSSMHPTAVCDVIPAVRCPVHAAIATSREPAIGRLRPHRSPIMLTSRSVSHPPG